MKKIAILVAGMHRSGTSALARTLNLAGCDLPETLLPAHPSNEAGHWEPRNIVLLNDEILASVGTAWNDWTAIDPRWYESPVAAAFSERAAAALENEFGDSRLFVLKDPRICRLLPFWIEAARALDADARVAIPIRNPQDVAFSLHTRDGISIPIGHLLWLRYVLDAESASRNVKRAWLRYDRLLAEPHAIIDRLGATLDVFWPKHASARIQQEIDTFLSRSLRHHRTTDAVVLDNPTLSRWLTASFAIFDRWTRGEEHGDDKAILDNIRAAFDAAIPAFRHAFASTERALAERDRAIQTLKDTVAERDRRAEKLAADAAERDRAIQTLKDTVAERDRRAEKLAADAAERDRAIQTLKDTVAERDRRAEKLAADAAERDRAIQTLKDTVAERDRRAEKLAADAAERDRAIRTLKDTVAERDRRAEKLAADAAERDRAIQTLKDTVAERDRRAEKLAADAAERNNYIETLNTTISDNRRRLNRLQDDMQERDKTIDDLYRSTSWRIASPLRWIRRLQLRATTKAAHYLFSVARFVYRALPLPLGFKQWIKTIIYRVASGVFFVRPGPQRAPAHPELPPECRRWAIVTTPHTLFVAKLLGARLMNHGWDVDILNATPSTPAHDMYIVICPQMFDPLPTGEKRIVYQMEQSVSSRWFTPEYLDTLNSARAVLEYNLCNIDYLKDRGIAFPHLNYLPVGGLAQYGRHVEAGEKKHDILFYGDNLSSPRRRHLLHFLTTKFDVAIHNDVFGDSIIEAIKEARIVVNLHYYQDGLLEVPRIFESLSLGVPVVSEASKDQDDYPELHGAVTFFEQGSVDSMLEAVETVLKDPPAASTVAGAVNSAARRFEFMFDRFLIAMNFLPLDYARQMPLSLPSNTACVTLSLPETIDRRNAYIADTAPKLPGSYHVFDGIRRQPAWIGCALSYVALARHGIKNRLSSMTIVEDDVFLPPRFCERLETTRKFLVRHAGEWDVFAGMISDVHPNTRILSVNRMDGIVFATIDRMVSMVFNIYSESAIQMLSSWNIADGDDETNTIDRFLERQNTLRIVVAIPFLVGHRANLPSTLWGISNENYSHMIRESETRLKDMIASYLNTNVTSLFEYSPKLSCGVRDAACVQPHRRTPANPVEGRPTQHKGATGR